jgi:HSP20 family protein
VSPAWHKFKETNTMSITHWDPISDAIGLRQVMDSLFEQSFVRPRAVHDGAGSGIALDLEDRGDAFVIEASVPGVPPEEVEISVTGDVVRIRAERRESRQESDPQGKFLVREQRFGVFERAVRLPAPVDTSAAQAEFHDGVLRIVLPRSAGSREQRIPVQAASSQGERPLSDEGQGAQSQKQDAATQEAGAG